MRCTVCVSSEKFGRKSDVSSVGCHCPRTAQSADPLGRIVGVADGATLTLLDAGLAQISLGRAWWFRKYANEQTPEDRQRYEAAEQESEVFGATELPRRIGIGG